VFLAPILPGHRAAKGKNVTWNRNSRPRSAEKKILNHVRMHVTVVAECPRHSSLRARPQPREIVMPSPRHTRHRAADPAWPGPGREDRGSAREQLWTSGLGLPLGTFMSLRTHDRERHLPAHPAVPALDYRDLQWVVERLRVNNDALNPRPSFRSRRAASRTSYGRRGLYLNRAGVCSPARRPGGFATLNADAPAVPAGLQGVGGDHVAVRWRCWPNAFRGRGPRRVASGVGPVNRPSRGHRPLSARV